MTFTAILPEAGVGKGRLTVLYGLLQAGRPRWSASGWANGAMRHLASIFALAVIANCFPVVPALQEANATEHRAQRSEMAVGVQVAQMRPGPPSTSSAAA